jgi:hypothetical protein
MSGIGPANARYYSADKLLSQCEIESLINRAICNGYLAGANDAHELHTELDEEAICIPAGASIERLRKVFVEYANEHPEELHLSAASLAMNAFIEAFPCE